MRIRARVIPLCYTLHMLAVGGIALTVFGIFVGWILGKRHERKLEAQNRMLLEVLATVTTLQGDEEARFIVQRYGQASQALEQTKTSLQQVRRQQANERRPSHNRNIGFHHRIMHLEEQLKRGPSAFMLKTRKEYPETVFDP